MINETYQVIEIVTTYGERLNAYESAAYITVESIVFQGSISDCLAFITLKEKGVM
jgi:hypothetical protein